MRIQGYPILLTELRQPVFPMQECAEIISQCNIIEAYIILVINVRSYKPSGHLPLVLIVDDSLVCSVPVTVPATEGQACMVSCKISDSVKVCLAHK